VEISAPASLLHEGRRLPLDEELTLGRSEENDIVLADERVSRRHARVFAEDGGYAITDLGSRHGTRVNGESLGEESRMLAPGDAIELGDHLIRFLSGQLTRMASREQAVIGVQTVDFEGKRLTLGRDEKNGVVLPDPNVSRFHAELVRDEDGGVELVDLGSRNGTGLNGELTTRARLEPGAEIGIGPFRIVFDGSSLTARDDRGSLRLDAVDVAMRVGDKQILHPTSISIEPGELVAFIGESGAGKTTLLKALAGVTRPTGGRITLNGEDLATRLTDVGYVPQDEIVHRLLDVDEALRYAARLRLPQDVSDEEIDSAVARVLGELSLDEQATTRIGSLSGGQRKRTGVAAELLSRPSILFLDEPTTGLDPGLETQMMQLLRELSRGGRAVAVVTHATKNLALCDRMVVMGRGGYRTFDGPPEEAVSFFEAGDLDGIYTALPKREPSEWKQRFEGTRERPVLAPQEEQAAKQDERPRPSVFPQLAVLVGRYLKLFSRDRRNVVLLLGQAPVLALFGVALFEPGLFDRPGGSPGDAVNMLFLTAITIIWLGAIDAAPEIVKERGVVEREAAIGTRLSAYIASKLVVLFGLVSLQTLLYAGLLLAFRPLNEGLDTYLTVFGLMLATGFAAVGMGMLVSSLVTTQDQAMSLIPLAVIPQLLFAGAIVTLERMGEAAKGIAEVIFGQWSLAGLGTAVDMNARLAENAEFAKVNRFGTDFFDVSAGTAFAAQGIFLVGFVAATTLLLRRRLRA